MLRRRDSAPRRHRLLQGGCWNGFGRFTWWCASPAAKCLGEIWLDDTAAGVHRWTHRGDQSAAHCEKLGAQAASATRTSPGAAPAGRPDPDAAAGGSLANRLAEQRCVLRFDSRQRAACQQAYGRRGPEPACAALEARAPAPLRRWSGDRRGPLPGYSCRRRSAARGDALDRCGAPRTKALARTPRSSPASHRQPEGPQDYIARATVSTAAARRRARRTAGTSAGAYVTLRYACHPAGGAGDVEEFGRAVPKLPLHARGVCRQPPRPPTLLAFRSS